jgi:hypothetical protein
MDLLEARDTIRTREDLARFVRLLRDDLLQNGDAWENPTLDRYLEALGAWVADLEGYFNNQNMVEPRQPSWDLVGKMLFAATVYE